MPDWEDYYEILDVNPDSSDEEIKDAYLYKVNILHPDRLSGASEAIRHRAEEDLKKANRAYEVLKDPHKRKEFHAEWIKRSPGPKKAVEKPKPVVDPPHIVFSNVEAGEVKRGSFTVRNMGGPYEKIFITDPDSWVRIIRCDSLATSDELPLQVEIEARVDDWGKSYSEYIKIKLDEEETFVRVDLQTKVEPVKSTVSGVAGAGAAKPPPVKSQVVTPSSKRRLWGFSILGVFIILVIVAVVNTVGEPTQPTPTPVPTETPAGTPIPPPTPTATPLKEGSYTLNLPGILDYEGATTWLGWEAHVEGRIRLEQAIVEGDIIRIYSTLTVDSITGPGTYFRNPGWGAGVSEKNFLRDDQGNTYPEVSAGGAFGRAETLQSGQSYWGHQEFHVPASMRTGMTFTYHAWYLRNPVQFTLEAAKWSSLPEQIQPQIIESDAQAVSITQRPSITPSGKGLLTANLKYADEKPIANRQIQVYNQRQDVGGNWIWGDQVASRSTDDKGRASFELAAESYALEIGGLEGYNWGNMANKIGQADVPLKADYHTEVVITLGRLTVELAYADGKPMVNKRVEVHTQREDVTGNWVWGDRITYKNTENSGMISFDLTPGLYALRISGLDGYNWGNMVGDVGEVNMAVRSGETTVKRVDLGRLTVGLTTTGGEAAQNTRVYVYTQKQDVSGKWVEDSQVTYRSTDVSGMVSFDLTPGQYAIRFRRPGEDKDQYLYSIVVEGGKITNCDGTTFVLISPETGDTEASPSISEGKAVFITQQATSTPSGKGLLEVGLSYAGGEPIVSQRVEVYSQQKDVSGNWVWGDRVTYKNTDNGGTVSFELEPGHYALRISAFQGYNWGNMVGDEGQVEVPVKTGYLTEVIITSGRLTVELAYADGKPMVNKRVEVYTQREDVTGNWVWGDRVTYKSTENSGMISFDLTPGLYALRISGLDGYNWGNMVGDVGEVNMAVRSGEMMVKRVDMGRLTVGLTTTGGEAAQNTRVYVYTQKRDVSGKWVEDSQVTYRSTDVSGMVSFDLTPGQYAIRFRRSGENEDTYLFNISMEGGKITTVVK